MNDKKYTELDKMRHTGAHILAAAVKKYLEEEHVPVKLAIGPPVENGFYYDFDLGERKISEKDFPKIEKIMHNLVNKKIPIVGREVSIKEAMKISQDQPYKLELINDFAEKSETVSYYSIGDIFEDLCRGNHTENTGEVGAFKIHRVAGAYWKGDETRPQLQRIYVLMFATEEELDAHLKMLVEAEKRDHRKLGKELELFTIINEVGPGLPLFYPKGAMLRRLLENYVIEEQEKRGYVPIWIPHITKGELYEISGHLDKYDAMYSPMIIDEDDYYLKPMNCPHFMMLYKTLPHSYKELPLRYTCTTTCYRYEKSGELSGLTRVRSLTQDDCHVFCTAEQIETEIQVMLEMIGDAYKVFGLNDFQVKISLRDPKDKEKYLGSDEVWNMAETALRNVVAKTGWKSEEEEGEAAFYGPKLDFKVKDAIGREWQLSTIQLDFNLPERFELEYTANDASKQRPVVIHRAILGSTERFMGILIEHMAGNFPTWLSPVQVKILTISDKFADYAKQVGKELREAGIRIELDERAESIGKKIRESEKEKVPYQLIIGEKEMTDGAVAVRKRHEGDKGAVSIQEFKDMILDEVKNKK